jgi:hypothetical protein
MMEHYNREVLKGKAAKIISISFHPLLMPVYGLLVIFFAPTLFWYLPLRVKEILFFIFLINNVLIPVSLMPFLRYRNLISSWMIEERSERVIPLLIVSLLYSVTSYIMFKLQIPVFVKAYTYSLALLAMVLFIINLKWKISLHSAGGGALTAVIFVLSVKMGVPLPVQTATALILSGIVMSARLKMNSHEPGQVYVGFITGFIIQGSLMVLFQ